ncbi:hypothetical protein B0H11DRAFT_2435728 [Mycena galericulata]|nr:hypothetical protein B0H11DRAFT_2435728 [Mycena galericulata]
MSRTWVERGSSAFILVAAPARTEEVPPSGYVKRGVILEEVQGDVRAHQKRGSMCAKTSGGIEGCQSILGKKRLQTKVRMEESKKLPGKISDPTQSRIGSSALNETRNAFAAFRYWVSGRIYVVGVFSKALTGGKPEVAQKRKLPGCVLAELRYVAGEFQARISVRRYQRSTRGPRQVFGVNLSEEFKRRGFGAADRQSLSKLLYSVYITWPPPRRRDKEPAWL